MMPVAHPIMPQILVHNNMVYPPPTMAATGMVPPPYVMPPVVRMGHSPVPPPQVPITVGYNVNAQEFQPNAVRHVILPPNDAVAAHLEQLLGNKKKNNGKKKKEGDSNTTAAVQEVCADIAAASGGNKLRLKKEGTGKAIEILRRNHSEEVQAQGSTLKGEQKTEGEGSSENAQIPVQPTKKEKKKKNRKKSKQNLNEVGEEGAEGSKDDSEGKDGEEGTTGKPKKKTAYKRKESVNTRMQAMRLERSSNSLSKDFNKTANKNITRIPK